MSDVKKITLHCENVITKEWLKIILDREEKNSEKWFVSTEFKDVDFSDFADEKLFFINCTFMHCPNIRKAYYHEQ